MDNSDPTFTLPDGVELAELKINNPVPGRNSATYNIIMSTDTPLFKQDGFLGNDVLISAATNSDTVQNAFFTATTCSKGKRILILRRAPPPPL